VLADPAFRHFDGSSKAFEFSRQRIPLWDESQVNDPNELIVVAHNWDEVRRFMWDYVGIVRTTKRLQRALRRVVMLAEEVQEFYSQFRVNRDLIELRNLVQVSELIVRSALARKESRGLHYTLDYPEMLDEAHDTILMKTDAFSNHSTASPSN